MTDTDQQITPADATIVSTGTGASRRAGAA